jgi:O-succinylhomoserine sulfhydrylase
VQQKEEAGITENLIRIAVGLEDIIDLKKDVLRGLSTI